MLQVRQLTKTYGHIVAVRDLDFSVGAGEVVGFLGPNAAGKTTTLRIIAGFLGPTSGSVRIADFDVVEDPERAQAQIGYMPEATPLYPELRVREYLDFRAMLKRVPRSGRRQAVQRALQRAAITDVSERLIGQLSKGYRQRVGLADALVAEPPLLILDEPTAGLDPNQIREVRSLIRDLRERHTILLSTHILSEVESVCDRALVIHHGQLVASGSLDELRRERRSAALRLRIRDPERKASELLGALAGVQEIRPLLRSAEMVEYRLLHERLGESEIERLCETVSLALGQAGLPLAELRREQASLEEVFSELTAGDPDRARTAPTPEVRA